MGPWAEPSPALGLAPCRTKGERESGPSGEPTRHVALEARGFGPGPGARQTTRPFGLPPDGYPGILPSTVSALTGDMPWASERSSTGLSNLSTNCDPSVTAGATSICAALLPFGRSLVRTEARTEAT